MTMILPYLWYPAFVGAAVVAFAAMLASGVSPATAAYAPIVLVAVVILALERWFPERLEWRPRWSDIKADATFIAVVQVILPRVLAALAVLAIAQWMHEHARSQWWPHAWPLAAQTIAMLLAVDLMRYWLHRACHSFTPLWRLHEVHHSPEILYSLNTGRFHPLEKALHFSLDTVPFLLLGVAPEVIAGYFLLYAVNGFFQHSNVRLRYGWLNYLVGSAETHRWHHARNPRTASCNFSNTTIVWDVVFGTWYLPKDKPVADIGITDKTYPKAFFAQMIAPFRVPQGRRRRSLGRWLADTLIALRLRLVWWTQGRRMATTARDPMRMQRRVLAAILHRNRATTFGRRHRFENITCYEQFAQHVAVADYEALRPFVEAEIERGENALTAEAPEQYARTSGSTGKPKDVPLTRSYLRALRRIQQTSVAAQYRACPEAFSGGIVALVGPAYEGALTNGKPFGSASGIVAGSTPALVREKFVIPAPVLTISDSRVKYLLMLRLALARPDVTYLGSANSTTLLTLIKLYREHEAVLIDDLARGTFFMQNKVPREIWSAVHARVRAQPDRAAELAQLKSSATVARIADLWPNLRLVVTWTGGSAGITVDALRRELSARTRVLELGYLASEFRGTFTIGKNAASGLPTFDTHFFEFAAREKWDSGAPEFLTLDRVRKGVDYYIIITTPSGLYRYFINDLVRVTGFLHKTPLLRFVQKGKGVTNITGEKLYEAQVLAAARAAVVEMGRTPRFVMMLADEQARRYRLYVEADSGPKPGATELAAAVDAKLRTLNGEYMAKRESERLGPISAAWLAVDTGEAYKQFCVKQGQREGQFKIVALAYRKDFNFDLDACTESC
jgi:sterol desaturase/sphingolipid hydroxylase (fatty acid hydroxylase superfamily)